MPALIFTIMIIGAVLALIFVNIRVISQGNQAIIERLGKYHTTWEAGLHVKLPIIDRVAKIVSVKETILDAPPQPVITKDNVTIKIDTVVYYKVFNARDYTYGAVDPIDALMNLTTTTLRNEVGALDLDTALTSRDTINGQLTTILDEATDKWGIRITRVELKNIQPPAEIQAAMEKQMKAERTKREAILNAEAHQQAITLRAEGDKRAKVLAAEGERDASIARAQGEAEAIRLQKQAQADGYRALIEAGITPEILELRKYDALISMANGTASKLIIPTDAVEAVTKNVIFSETAGIGDVTQPAPKPVIPAPEDECCESEDVGEINRQLADDDCDTETDTDTIETI